MNDEKKKIVNMLTHPDSGHHEGDVVEVGHEEDPDGGAVPYVLDHGLDRLALEAVHQLARVLRLPGDAPDLGGGVAGPHALGGRLGGLLGLLQGLVVAVVAHLGQALAHQQDGGVLRLVGVLTGVRGRRQLKM